MLKNLYRTFINSLFPSKCLACGTFFHPQPGMDEIPVHHMVHIPIKNVFYRVMTLHLCAACITDFSPVHSPLCIRCGKMFESRSGEDHLCGDCITSSSVCDRIRAVGIYTGALKSNIHALKYRHKSHLSLPLGRLLFVSFLKYYDIKQIDVIVPVPLHVSRLKQRGFNQTTMLIREWPELIHQIYKNETVKLDCDHLVRKRKTVSQTGLGRRKRIQNVKGAFKITDSSRFFRKRVLLIDDVYTTGSTSDECAKMLIAEGAKSVSVLTMARAN